MALASLQSKGIPKPSTNNFFIWEERAPNIPNPIRSIFCISPEGATISYSKPHYAWGSGADIPTNIVTRAWSELSRFGVDSKQLKFKNLTSSFCNKDERGRDLSNRPCGRGVFLSRQLDGISFFGNGNDGNEEGFWIEFASQGQIRAFSLNWPDLDRYRIQQTASPKQMIECIRKRKALFVPAENEVDYFARIKQLAAVQTLRITKITPYYAEGVFGQEPTNNAPAEFVTPLAEVEIVADFGTNKTAAVVVLPILSSDVNRLLENKADHTSAIR